jgi:O-antigen/teichoic acid export membrane protein
MRLMRDVAPMDAVEPAVERDTTRNQVRGSSLLLTGRFLSMGLNFAAQIYVVRYLSTTDYGALAYGLAVVAFLRLFATLGLHEGVSRFVPVYRENREFGKLFGTICLAGGAVVVAAGLLVAGVYELFFHFMGKDKLVLSLLSILLVLVPFEAADGVLDGLFASLAGTRDIFFRKYVLGPGLKLAVVILLVWNRSSVTFLAYGLVVTGAASVLIYSLLLVRLLRAQHILQHFTCKNLAIPAREVLAFVVPGISAVLATSAIPSINIFLLGWLRSLADVAYYRAAVPVAELNGIVLATFSLLYIPSAARLVSRENYIGLNKLYWDMSAWMSVLSFPIFAATFSFAYPVVVFLYGARYAPSAPALALLSLGSYLNVALGFNLQTLKVLERLRYIIVVSVVAILVNVVLSVLLIPRFGATGAATAAAVAVIGYNVLLQVGLRPASGFKIVDRRYASIYLLIGFSACALYVLQAFSPMTVWTALPLAGCVFMLVLGLTRRKLSIAETFPELLRVPLMRLILV